MRRQPIAFRWCRERGPLHLPLLISVMVSKRVQFDEETWAAIEAVANESGLSLQEVAHEAFADFLKKHKQPVGLRQH